MKQNVVLKLAYDGSSFFGWQKTTSGNSIEGTLQTCLERILQESISLQDASRTDRGVHAEGQWVNFYTEKKMSFGELQKGLNALLPTTIRVLSIYSAPLFFHPTLHAQKKEYHYHLCYGPLQLPNVRLYSLHVPYHLDIKKMVSASDHFLGEHDFSSFCNFRKNLHYKDKIRRIDSIEILNPHEGTLIFSLQGNHFLYKMVRNIVGTLIYVGRGKIGPETIPSLLDKRSRQVAGMTAPAHGLTLKKIYYPQEFKLPI